MSGGRGLAGLALVVALVGGIATGPVRAEEDGATTCTTGEDPRPTRLAVVLEGTDEDRATVEEALATATAIDAVALLRLRDGDDRGDEEDEDGEGDGPDRREPGEVPDREDPPDDTRRPEAGPDGRRAEDGATGDGASDWQEGEVEDVVAALSDEAEQHTGPLVVVYLGEPDRLGELVDSTPTEVYVRREPLPLEGLTGDVLVDTTIAARDDFFRSTTRGRLDLRRSWADQASDPSLEADASAPGSWSVDVRGRPVGERWVVSDLEVDGVTVICADAGGDGHLPVRLTGAAPGAEVRFSVTPDGLTDHQPLSLTGTLPETGSVPDGAGTEEPGTEDVEAAAPLPASATGGDGGRGPLLPVGALVVLLGLVAGVWTISRRRVAEPATVAPGPGAGPEAGGGPSPGGPPAGATAAAAPTGAPRPKPPPPPPAPTPAGEGWTTNRADAPTIGVDSSGTPVDPVPDGPTRRTWEVPLDGGLAMAGWSEKVPGSGEDADPLVHVHRSGAGLIAVFDGTGGSGSAIAHREPDGTERTGAWVASRLAREVTCDWANVALTAPAGSPVDDSLADRLRSWSHRIASQTVSTTTVRGSLHRVLPTTLAAVAVRPDDGRATVDALWAGDSRCFVLRPDVGLQALSTDDTRETDALALIRDDQPMRNLVSADREFSVNHRRIRVALPAVLLVATDGCFGYVATPAHFEYHLLRTLDAAETPRGWVESLTATLDGLAGDDTSIAVLCPGMADFDLLRRAVRPRLEHLEAEHWLPYRDAADDEARETAREASWATYRPHFEALRGEDGA